MHSFPRMLTRSNPLLPPLTSPAIGEEKGYDFVPSTRVTAPKVMAKVLKGKSRPQAMLSKSKRKKQNKKQNKSSRRKNAIRSPLHDVSASSVSLQDAADFAGVVWKYGSYALAALNVEEKETYQLLSNGVTTGSANIFQPIQMAQGTDYNQRIGDSIKVSNMRLDLILQANATAVSNFTRIMVVRDFMNQGALFAAGDIFQDTTSQAAVVLSPYLHTIGDRFEVLLDEVFTTTLATDSNLIHKRYAFGIGDHVLFQGTSSAIGSTWQGNIYVVVSTDQATNGPKLIMSSLINFIDN
jgi:hypothetical protein